MNDTDKTSELLGLFNQKHLWKIALLIILFILAALIRLDEIKAPGHLIDREYTAAIFARAFYFENNESIEPWRREIARITMESQPILEPPLTDLLVSWIYRLMGREEIWYARFLTNAFWLIGGIFMYLMVKILLPGDAALFATGYYLFVPMGVEISRSFQPDALMMMMFLISLYCIVRYFQFPSWRSLILAGILTGITILLRPLVLFGLLCAFFALSIFQKNGKWLRVIDKSFLVFSMLSLAPAVVYYGYGIFIADFMSWKIPHSFRPYLFLKWKFWLGWFELAAEVVGHAALILALLGFSLLQNKMARVLVIGLTIGYVIFGMFFTYHTHTHPYYHIQLIPIVGICASSFLISIIDLMKKSPSKSWQATAIIALLIVSYFSYKDIRASLYKPVFEDPNTDKEIGEIVHHSPRTVFVAHYYGIPLEYYGELSGAAWPVRIDDPFYRRPDEKELTVQERIDALGFVPEFFVITHFDLFNRKHQDLRAYLDEHCSIEAQTDRYLVYSSCELIDNN